MGYKRPDYKRGEEAEEALRRAQEHSQGRPGEYVSQNQEEIDRLRDKISNRDFEWDPKTDAMYQQQVDQYVTQGKMAMQDTIGQASAMTGGYGNSYAQTAGQQVYNRHLTEAAGLAPQYQDMALRRYQAEGDEILRQYDIVRQKEQDEYGRYQDNLSRYLEEQRNLEDRAEREADRDYDRWLQEQESQHRTEREEEEDRRYQEQWEHQTQREEKEDQRYADEQQHRLDREELEDQRYKDQWERQLAIDALNKQDFENKSQKEAWEKILMLMSSTEYRPTDEELEKAGMTKEQAEAIWQSIHGDGSGGGGQTMYERWWQWQQGQNPPSPDSPGDIDYGGDMTLSPEDIYHTAQQSGASAEDLNGLLTEWTNNGKITPEEARDLATGRR